MELKYHGGDLGREIAFPIKKRYRRNLERKAAARGLWMEIWEEDSLLPVMQIGEVPLRSFPIGMVQIVIVCYPVLMQIKNYIYQTQW